VAVCGDGIVQTGVEECDGGDLCTADCHAVTCQGATDLGDVTALCLGVTTYGTITATLPSLLSRYGGGACTSGLANPGVEAVYRIQVPANTSVLVDMLESILYPDTDLNLFVVRDTGDCNPAVDCVDEDVSVCPDPLVERCSSIVEIPAEATDQQYYVVVEHYSGTKYFFALSFACP
jgi:hypothetical protein